MTGGAAVAEVRERCVICIPFYRRTTSLVSEVGEVLRGERDVRDVEVGEEGRGITGVAIDEHGELRRRDGEEADLAGRADERLREPERLVELRLRRVAG